MNVPENTDFSGDGENIIFYTSANINYFAKARALAESVKLQYPKSKFALLLPESNRSEVKFLDYKIDHVLDINEIHPFGRRWIFEHTIVELATAIKAAGAIKLSSLYKPKFLVYLDPDMIVLNKLIALDTAFRDMSIVLTPHISKPTESKQRFGIDLACMRHGTYNLGFLALRNDKIGQSLLNWWNARLMFACFDTPEKGVFTDQKWFDIVPAIFDGVSVLRDERYNVASWNLEHRNIKIDRQADTPLVNGRPVVLWHFAGFDNDKAKLNRAKFFPELGSEFDEICEWYKQKIYSHDDKTYTQMPWEFGFFKSGRKIKKFDRRVVKNSPRKIKTNPFDLSRIQFFRIYYLTSARRQFLRLWKKIAS